VSIAVLTQVYDEVRRLAIAGSVVAPGDFRLKKLVPALEKAGEKAPVFAKVAGSAAKLIDSNEKSSAEALLELSTLINAVLYTQGETGAAGELCPIETTNVRGHHTRTTARMLKPLLEALTTTGSGRLEIIRDAFERGAFSDLRLVKPALAAIDDPYPEIADFLAEKVLPQYGKAVLPELRAKFDLKGKGGHPRRLALMHRIDPEATGPLVKEALENGSKEVKVVAIECLGTWPERLLSYLKPLSYLLEQATAKAKDVRQAALKALAKINEKEAVAVLKAALKGDDIELVEAPIRASNNPQLIEAVLHDADALLTQLTAGKEKDKKVIGKQTQRTADLLFCLPEKASQPVEAFLLKWFAARENLAKVKAEPSGEDIIRNLVGIMADASEGTRNAIIDARDSLAAESFVYAFVAACKNRSAAEVYEQFGGYLVPGDNAKKKSTDILASRSTVICELLTNRWQTHWQVSNYTWASEENFLKRFDTRWLDLAVKQRQLSVVQSLARPGHAGAAQLLADEFGRAFKSKDPNSYVATLQALVLMEHPRAADFVLAAIAKEAKAGRIYGFGWLGQLIPQLPKTALPAVENLIPTLPDKVMDQLLEYVTELKTKA